MPVVNISPNDACPCHSGAKYKKCCRACHLGQMNPPTPLALMRSRYSAYALGLTDYIIATTDPDGPRYEADRAAWERSIGRFSRTTRFAGLDILATDGDTVTFRAVLFSGDDDTSFTEKSAFRKIGDRWVYVGPL